MQAATFASAAVPTASQAVAVSSAVTASQLARSAGTDVVAVSTQVAAPAAMETPLPRTRTVPAVDVNWRPSLDRMSMPPMPPCSPNAVIVIPLLPSRVTCPFAPVAASDRSPFVLESATPAAPDKVAESAVTATLPALAVTVTSPVVAVMDTVPAVIEMAFVLGAVSVTSPSVAVTLAPLLPVMVSAPPACNVKVSAASNVAVPLSACI